jgi:hypothetical protein
MFKVTGRRIKNKLAAINTSLSGSGQRISVSYRGDILLNDVFLNDQSILPCAMSSRALYACLVGIETGLKLGSALDDHPAVTP